MKKALCLCLVITMLFVLTSCKSKEAKNADELILRIGAVTLESEQAILDAVNNYESLTDEDKSEIENYAILQQAQIDYLNAILDSIEDICIDDKELLLKAQNYYNSWDLEHSESEMKAKLEQIGKDYAKIEAFEKVKEYIKTNGNAVTEGGVNNSNAVKQWNYNGIVLYRGGTVEFTYTEIIKDKYGNIIQDDDDDYAKTKIIFDLDADGISLEFYSFYEQNDFLDNDVFYYAKGRMNNILYESYTIDGALPNIYDYSPSITNMYFYKAPFKTDEAYGEYIRGVIHNGIHDVLSIFKDILGDDMVNLGFSTDVIASIE